MFDCKVVAVAAVVVVVAAAVVFENHDLT